MVLRDRQIGGIPLDRASALILTIVCTVCIPVIGYTIWFPFFGIPEELRKWIAFFGCCLYVSSCAGLVKVGTERAQLFFGTYTGISFPAGIYLLPRIPFPIISLLLVLVDKKIAKYLGWLLEGDVSVESIVTSFKAEGVTSDGIRVTLEGALVLEVSDAAVFLSQRANSTNKVAIEDALRAEFASRIKRKVISKHTALELYQGNFDKASSLSGWVTDVCKFVKDFGLRLSRSPVVSVDIQSERIKKSFDSVNARKLMLDNTNSVAVAFKEFSKRLPPGTSEEVAMIMFNSERMDNNQQPVDMSILKLK